MREHYFLNAGAGIPSEQYISKGEKKEEPFRQ